MGKKWYCRIGPKHLGPMSAAELRDLARRGELRPDDTVWSPGMDVWMPAKRGANLWPEDGPFTSGKPRGTPCYAMTDQEMRTGQRKWILGEDQTVDDQQPSSPLIAYWSQNLASLCAPGISCLPGWRLFSAEGDVVESLSHFSCSRVVLIKEEALPYYSNAERVAFAILCSYTATCYEEHLRHEELCSRSVEWCQWAEGWLKGESQSSEEAMRVVERQDSESERYWAALAAACMADKDDVEQDWDLLMAVARAAMAAAKALASAGLTDIPQVLETLVQENLSVPYNGRLVGGYFPRYIALISPTSRR